MGYNNTNIVIYGDSQANPQVHTALTGLMLKNKPDLMLHVGDMVSKGSDIDNWDKHLFKPAQKLLSATPFFTAIGNHEEDSPLFYKLLEQPGNGHYFAFKYGNIFIVIIDSNPKYLYSGSKELEWIENTLMSDASQNSKWLLAFAHHPPYSEGWSEPGYDGDIRMRTLVQPIAEKSGVDIFFNGHTHNYERGFLNGVTWVTTGGGGGALDTKQQDWEHISVFKSDWHFVQIQTNEEQLNLQAISVNDQIIDQFRIINLE